MENRLIVYFSASGTTKFIADKLGNLENIKVIEIVPKEKYLPKDLNWINPFSRSSKEHKNRKIKPEIENKIEDFESYREIIIGFPVWWYDAPNIIYTFLDSYNFNEKSVKFFCTSSMTGIETCMPKIEEYIKTNKLECNLKESIRLTRDFNEEEVKSWLEK